MSFPNEKEEKKIFGKNKTDSKVCRRAFSSIRQKMFYSLSMVIKFHYTWKRRYGIPLQEDSLCLSFIFLFDSWLGLHSTMRNSLPHCGIWQWREGPLNYYCYYYYLRITFSVFIFISFVFCVHLIRRIGLKLIFLHHTFYSTTFFKLLVADGWTASDLTYYFNRHKGLFYTSTRFSSTCFLGP